MSQRYVMASAGARAYKGVWGLCPQWGQGAKPLVRGSGGRRPPDAEAFKQMTCTRIKLVLIVLCFLETSYIMFIFAKKIP